MTSNNNHLPDWATQETDPAQYMKPHIPNMQYEEPTLTDCPYCQGKHEDVEQCPLAPKRYAVVRSWKTALMPGIAFNTYHQECWPGPETPSLVEANNVRLVPIGEIAQYATCSVCHGLIAQPPDIDTRDMWNAHIFP